jgi:hypothetical protein
LVIGDSWLAMDVVRPSEMRPKGRRAAWADCKS